MGLPTTEVPLQTEGLAKVPERAKLLRSVPAIRVLQGNIVDLCVDQEVADELAAGDLIAAPSSHGDLQPFEIIEVPSRTPGPTTQESDVWVRTKPARGRTLQDELAEMNVKDSGQREQEKARENARVRHENDAIERGADLLRASGFAQLADAIERREGELEVRYAFLTDAAAMPDIEAEETEIVH